MKMKLMCLLILSLICLQAVGCSPRNKINPQPIYDEKHEANVPESFTAAENSNYSLSWDNNTKRLTFFDKNKNIPWSYFPYQSAETRYDEDGFEMINHPQTLSPVNIKYVNRKDYVVDSSIGHNESVKKGDFSVNKIEEGVSITYYFANVEISLTVDYVLKENNLEITVDPKKITESNYLLTEVSIAPFFCSIPNKAENAYLFVPSGSGALVYADKTSDDINIVSEPMYGPDAFTPEDNVIKTTKETVKLPVFGAKNGGTAVAAIIKSGAESTSINTNAGNNTIGYSAVYAVFEIRKNEAMVTNNGSQVRHVYADACAVNPVVISYYPLYGEKASYVGMAECYREYLKETGSLKTDFKQSMLNLQVLGGTMVTQSVFGVPHDSVLVTSTIEQTEKMINEIYSQSGLAPAVQLLGYGETGLDIGKIAGDFQINKKIGTVSRLKSLIEKSQKQGIEIFFNYDALQFNKSSSAASAAYDTAKTTNGRKASMYYYHLWSGTKDTTQKGWNTKRSFFLLSRSLIPHVVDKIARSAKDDGLKAISLDTLSSIAYSDYSEQKYYSKGLVSQQTAKALQSARKQGLSVAGNSSNDYFAANSDYIFDTPSFSSKYDIYAVDVPFYQLVFRGNIPLASKPVNASSDSARSILNAIETGTGLTYALSYRSDQNIIFADDRRYFGSNYSSVKDKLLRDVNENKEYYSAVGSSEITQHDLVTDTLRKTVFANGTVVYVNYGEKAVQTPIGVVEPASYAFAAGGSVNE